MNNVCNVAPCHLPGIYPTIDHTLARPDMNLACKVCAFVNEEDIMLTCDGCGSGWHTMCLQPPLQSILRVDWLCPRCIADGVSVADLRAVRKNQVPAPGQLLRGGFVLQIRVVPLFQDVVSCRRSQELAAFEVRTVAHKERHGGQLRSRLGRVHYSGAGAGLKCFQVMFEDGRSMTMSGVEA
eukprot:502103-Pelagomonas_calceolata.AAC.1